MEHVKNNKILLHSCCAVCSAYPIQYLLQNGYEPIVYFCNPNIDTKCEFDKRLFAQEILCKYFNVKLIVEEYNHDEYLKFVLGLEHEPEKGKRCENCFRLRLSRAKEKAEELLIKEFTTSLAISPHKNFEQIAKIGESVANNDFTKFIAINFRKNDGFLKTNKIVNELGLYRQNYCGCEFAKQHLT